MKTPIEPSRLLDRGGKPTVRELLSSLIFNPVDGTIRLNGDRIVIQRAAVGAELRRELIRLLGEEEARVFLLRLGFLSGQADARFVRTNWPNVDVGDAFSAGTRLHTFTGVVRVETVYNEFDFRKKRFAAEFLWHDSVEASEHKRLRRTATEPVCWTQLGYASGYASEFFDALIVYREMECAAQGHRCCRIIGKPAEAWGAGDPDVILFRERVAIGPDADGAAPSHRVVVQTAESALSELDRIILAPVRAELERLAHTAVPVLIAGASGTGRRRAARFLHRASGAGRGELRVIFGDRLDADLCAEISRRPKGSRRTAASDAILIDGAEKIPEAIQAHFTRAIEEGMLVGGPRLIVLIKEDQTAKSPILSPDLWSALSAFSVRMPPLAERHGQLTPIAHAMLRVIAAQINAKPPQLDDAAASAIERGQWPGNLRQLRAVLSAALVGRRGEHPISRQEIETQLQRFPYASRVGDGGRHTLFSHLDDLIAEGGFSLFDLERSAYKAALEQASGNLSAAARLLGLTRAQLAYRVSADKIL